MPPLRLLQLLRSSCSTFITISTYLIPALPVAMLARSSFARVSNLATRRVVSTPASCVASQQRFQQTHAISNPTLADIERRWEAMPPQEQADLWMALRDRMKKDWNELTMQEKKAGMSLRSFQNFLRMVSICAQRPTLAYLYLSLDTITNISSLEQRIGLLSVPTVLAPKHHLAKLARSSRTLSLALSHQQSSSLSHIISHADHPEQ